VLLLLLHMALAHTATLNHGSPALAEHLWLQESCAWRVQAVQGGSNIQNKLFVVQHITSGTTLHCSPGVFKLYKVSLAFVCCSIADLLA
jgi:hypothetical protein